MNTHENKNGKKLDGLTPSPTREQHALQLNPSKKHTRKHHGYIRGLKKANGRVYYYYCWAERNAAGEYLEKSEYMGTAERIRAAVKEEKEKANDES